MHGTKQENEARREQYYVLRRIEDWLEMPMFVLSLVWVVLLVVELAWGTSTELETAITTIWVIFVSEFLLKFVIAPKKTSFLRRNWVTVLALALPALRVFRAARAFYVLRAGRAIRGLTLARVLTAFNRGLRSMKTTMGRVGFDYVMMLTALVTILGAAGMYRFERHVEGGLGTFGDALWFTAMIVTTLGSDYWPKTFEGRLLCFLIALYAFAVFGYVTATLATLLVGQEAKARRVLDVDARLAALRLEMAELNQRLAASGPPT
jgi:voltage-gated potassium channel